MGSKGLGEFLVGLLGAPEHAPELLRQTTAFGWAPAHAFLLDSVGAPTFEGQDGPGQQQPGADGEFVCGIEDEDGKVEKPRPLIESPACFLLPRHDSD